MVTRERMVDGRREQCAVSRSDDGWVVTERVDDRVVATKRCVDWHRVEFALWEFDVRDRTVQGTN